MVSGFESLPPSQPSLGFAELRLGRLALLADVPFREVSDARRLAASVRGIGASFVYILAVDRSIMTIALLDDDLKVPPGNRLHPLGGDKRGLHAVRVNDQYRIVFRLEGGDAFDVRCTDYH